MNVRSCQTCGTPVVKMATIGGAAYYVPVAENQLQKVLTVLNVEEFLRDRLHRAERIIIDLRKQLKEEKSGD